MTAPTDIAAVLNERGRTHGDYADHANYTQSLKRIALCAMDERHQRGQQPLSDMQRESLDMILHKVGRILAGNPDVKDHWTDIAGYAALIEQRLGGA